MGYPAVLLLLLLPVGLGINEVALAARPDVDDVSQSVAVVETADGRGSGFVVDDRLLMTAAHVASRGDVVARFGSKAVSGSVIAVDPANDLALIRLASDVTADPLSISASPPRLGEDVFAIGAPTDGGLTVTRGIVSAVLDSGEIQTDASVNPGNSGGPLVRPDGSVIGVITLKARAEGIGYAVGAEHLLALIELPPGSEPSAEGYGKVPKATIPGAQPLRPTGSNGTGPVLLPVGIAGTLIVLALALLGLRIRSTRRTDDFKVHLGPVHDRFGD